MATVDRARVLASRYYPWALVLLASFAAENLLKAGTLNPYVHHVLVTCGINVLLALSLNMLCGFVGQFSLGHAAFMAVGAYVSAYLTVRLGVPFLPSLVVSGMMGAFFGFLVGVPSFRTQGFYLTFITLGFNLLLVNVIENAWVVGGARGFPEIPTHTTLPLLSLLVIAAIVVMRNVLTSTFGRAMGAVREDEFAAELTGINPMKFKIVAAVISGFFAGVAGSLYAHYFSFLHPSTFTQTKSIDILTMVYLGGVGSISGPVVGAVFVTVFLEVLRPFGIWRLVLMPLLLVLLIVFRPQGLLGGRELPLILDLRHLGDLTPDSRFGKEVANDAAPQN